MDLDSKKFSIWTQEKIMDSKKILDLDLGKNSGRDLKNYGIEFRKKIGRHGIKGSKYRMGWILI